MAFGPVQLHRNIISQPQQALAGPSRAANSLPTACAQRTPEPQTRAHPACCSSSLFSPQSSVRGHLRKGSSISTAAVATEEEAPVGERLSGEDADQWQASLQKVKALGYSDEDASKLLERAFGWGTQTFWRGLKTEEVPRAESVAATLGCLRELGMTNDDIQAAFKKFPEGLASDVEERIKPNLETLQKDYYIPKKNLLAAIKRQPRALGFSYDCEGSCEGECHRCWVRF